MSISSHFLLNIPSFTASKTLS